MFYITLIPQWRSLKTASFTEKKSGFVLNELNADFLFTDKETYLKNLYIKKLQALWCAGTLL